MIKNKELVTEHFGYWPVFADTKIKKVNFDKPEKIELSIFYIDTDKSKHGNVEIKFLEISDVHLHDLMSENVIDKLSIGNGSPHNVEIEACFGLNGTFCCKEIEVIRVST